ncbi:CLCA_X family protein [Marinobacter bohaiensis]|uniref:CLCA_X family protein n=1 Tax=Marinobacter bohaiensis TaxID=2201898 RepID=UPI000DADBE0C|nr:CLCA_X family protein [Marinobacter bohaiensis]
MSQSFYRRGPDHRAGASVTFLDVRRRFQFRSVEIGRWVTEPEKQRSAGLFYDALCDLMTTLGGTESLISLRGTLGLQYGIGGQRGVSAHYTPATRSFALAKNAGPGSIAHEWFHAFDHYICDKLYTGSPPGAFASKRWLGKASGTEHPLNRRLQRCFAAVMLDADGNNPSHLFRQSVKADKAAGTLYFSQPEELCARAFEAFVQDGPCKNAFLVKGTRATEEARLGLYPTGEERERINRAFADYFRSLGAALKWTESV